MVAIPIRPSIWQSALAWVKTWCAVSQSACSLALPKRATLSAARKRATGEDQRERRLSDRRLDRFSDPNRIVAKQLPSKRRMFRPAIRAVACREQRRQLASRFVTKRDKIDRLSPFSRFLGAPGRRHLADDGRQ